MPKQIALVILIVFLYATSALAQDNNLLAKLAHENAETALSEKNLSEGLNELAKVDQLLGKLTPRSQYLACKIFLQNVDVIADTHNPATITT
jgi:hypothetical protein